jgi:hypothetical protein
MELIDEYLAALEVGDAERVLALFAPDGIVQSPLYGAVPARQFYPTLFADTAELRLTLRRVFRDDGERWHSGSTSPGYLPTVRRLHPQSSTSLS